MPQLSCIEMEEEVVVVVVEVGGYHCAPQPSLFLLSGLGGIVHFLYACTLSLSPIDLKMLHRCERWTGVGRTSRHKIIARMSPLQSCEVFIVCARHRDWAV